MPISFNCECCGKAVINRNIAQFRREKNHYCSVSCARKSKLSLADRFEQYIFYSPDGCHYWIGAIKPDGYGTFALRSHQFINAHRVSYMIYRGEIPDGKFICHTCDNRKCVNPDHLFLGTQKDNIHDMHTKGRARVVCRGEGHIDAKLSTSKVLEIRRRVDNGEVGADLAKEFGVHKATVYSLVLRKSWKHI